MSARPKPLCEVGDQVRVIKLYQSGIEELQTIKYDYDRGKVTQYDVAKIPGQIQALKDAVGNTYTLTKIGKTNPYGLEINGFLLYFPADYVENLTAKQRKAQVFTVGTQVRVIKADPTGVARLQEMLYDCQRTPARRADVPDLEKELKAMRNAVGKVYPVRIADEANGQYLLVVDDCSIVLPADCLEPE